MALNTTDEPTSTQYQFGSQFMDRLDLCQYHTIVDAGCGTGLLTARLCRKATDAVVLAVDSAPAMLKLAAENLRSFGERVRVIGADVHYLPVHQSVDLIFSASTFHWIIEHDLMFSALWRALHEGGALAATCGGGPNLQRLRARLREVTQLPELECYFIGWTPPHHFPTAEDTEQRLKGAGYTDIHVELQEAPTMFDSASQYARTVAIALKPQLARLPSVELRHRLITSIVAAAARDAPPFTLDYCRLHIIARKP